MLQYSELLFEPKIEWIVKNNLPAKYLKSKGIHNVLQAHQ